MRHIRKAMLVLAVGAVALLALPAGITADDTTTLDVRVSPSNLNIDRDGTCVTVHTDLAYEVGNDYVWLLNGVSADTVTSDLRGNLVAKFDSTAIIATVQTPESTLMLEGTTADGVVVYTGSDTIRVNQCSR